MIRPMGRSTSILPAGLATMILLALSAGRVPAQQEPRMIQPPSLKLAPSPAGGGVLSADAAGNPAQAGSVYAVHVRYPAGAKSFPHTHPDQRVVTVISGTFYMGLGPDFDEKALVALKPGTLMILPANAVHFAWAKDGEVVVQELGTGPSGTKLSPAR